MCAEEKAKDLMINTIKEMRERRLPKLLTNLAILSFGLENKEDAAQDLICRLVPSNKLFYIGKTSGSEYFQRWADPKHRKNKPKTFVLVFQTKNENEVDNMETAMIKLFHAQNRLFNSREGRGGRRAENPSLFYVYIIY
jgi:hypothetical protein